MHRLVPLGLLAAGCGGIREDPIGFDALLVSIDGASWALLDEEWAHLETLPGIAPAPIPIHLLGYADTPAAHARMLTGYGPEVTGVLDRWHDPPIPAGLTLHERLRARWGESLHLSFVSNKPKNLAIDPGLSFQHAGDASDWTYAGYDPTAGVGARMRDALDDGWDRPLFALFHFAEVDEAGHRSGERSWDQRQALRAIDAELGLVLERLREREREARIYVTADHGFTPGTNYHEEKAHHVWLVCDDPALDASEGEIDEIAWTFLDLYDAEDEALPPPEGLGSLRGR